MKLSIIAVLALSTAACDTDGLLGTEFYAGNHLQGVEVEAAAPEAGAEASDDEAGDDASPDAGGDSASQMADSGHDAAHEADVDSGEPAETSVDSGAPDSGETMEATVEAEAGATCPGALPCDNLSFPANYCRVPHQGDGVGQATTPTACTTCETYSCACVLASAVNVGCTCSLSADGAVMVVCP